MKLKLSIFPLISLAIMMSACNSFKEVKQTTKSDVYQETWSSLREHNTPNWLMNAKFGIYSHWGPASIIVNQPKNEQDTYLEALNKWTGEKFNADQWAEMYKDAGAQFAGCLGMHGSGVVYWDSKITKWNATNYGPKKDVFGSVIKAVKARGLKSIGTFHAIRPSAMWGKVSIENPKIQNPNMIDRERMDTLTKYNDRNWMQGWYERVREAYTNYDLDLVWFDTSYGVSVGAEIDGAIHNGKYNYNGGNRKRYRRIGGVSETYQKKLIADYYNQNVKKNKDVDVIYKTNDMPVNVGMRDIENGNLDGLQYDPWMADINIMQHKYSWTWFYMPKNPLKDANTIVDMLIDMTSKNGRMLLNVPPQADGSFAPKVKEEMHEIGQWLKINGEGIYGTNPWAIYGEGPTNVTHPGQHGQGAKAGAFIPKYTSKDIRYTCKNNCIYVFSLTEPKDNIMHMHALGSHMKLYPGEIKKITLLGFKGELSYNQKPEVLDVILPKKMKKSYAYCIKIERK